LEPGDCVIDVGANVGHFRATAAEYVGSGGSVHSLEANPSLFKRLADMTVEDSGGPIRPQYFAVGATSGLMEFDAANVSGWSSLVANDTF